MALVEICCGCCKPHKPSLLGKSGVTPGISGIDYAAFQHFRVTLWRLSLRQLPYLDNDTKMDDS